MISFSVLPGPSSCFALISSAASFMPSTSGTPTKASAPDIDWMIATVYSAALAVDMLRSRPATDAKSAAFFITSPPDGVLRWPPLPCDVVRSALSRAPRSG